MAAPFFLCQRTTALGRYASFEDEDEDVAESADAKFDCSLTSAFQHGDLDVSTSQ